MAQAIVYTKNNCVYCKQVKTYLSENNISYEERNVEENEQYMAELEKMEVMSLPVTVIGEYQILGLNKTRFQKALDSLK